MPPHAAVHTHDEEGHHLRRHDHRQRSREHVEVLQELDRTLEPQAVRRVVAHHDQAEIEQDFRHAALVHEVDDDRRQRALLGTHVRIVVDADAGQIGGEEHHPDQKGGGREEHGPFLAELTDADAKRAAHTGQNPQQRDGAAFRQPDGHEPVRRMIPAAL